MLSKDRRALRSKGPFLECVNSPRRVMSNTSGDSETGEIRQAGDIRVWTLTVEPYGRAYRRLR